MVIRAKYENGVLKPLDAVTLKEGTLLEIQITPGDKMHPSIREFAYVGMWRKRDDIQNGTSYVDRIRDNPRN